MTFMILLVPKNQNIHTSLPVGHQRSRTKRTVVAVGESLVKGVLTGTAAHCTLTLLRETSFLSTVKSAATRALSFATEHIQATVRLIQPYVTPRTLLGTAAGVSIGYVFYQALASSEQPKPIQKIDQMRLKVSVQPMHIAHY